MSTESFNSVKPRGIEPTAEQKGDTSGRNGTSFLWQKNSIVGVEFDEIKPVIHDAERSIDEDGLSDESHVIIAGVDL
jgi:hypothetical protein